MQPVSVSASGLSRHAGRKADAQPGIRSNSQSSFPAASRDREVSADKVAADIDACTASFRKAPSGADAWPAQLGLSVVDSSGPLVDFSEICVAFYGARKAAELI